MPEIAPGVRNSDANEPDDPSYPYKLEASLGGDAHVLTCVPRSAGRTYVVRSTTLDALEAVLRRCNLRRHPHLTHFVLSGPDGLIEKLPAQAPAQPAD